MALEKYNNDQQINTTIIYICTQRIITENVHINYILKISKNKTKVYG